MTEGAPIPLHEVNFDLPTEEQAQQIRSDWENYWNVHKQEILPREEMERRLLEKSDPTKNVQEEIVPGVYEFDSPQVLYVVYASLFGEQNARREVSHEVEHHKVYEKYSIPCSFGIALSRMGGNMTWGVGILLPHFPDDFDGKKRQAIINEANLAVSQVSPRDKEALRKFNTSHTVSDE